MRNIYVIIGLSIILAACNTTRGNLVVPKTQVYPAMKADSKWEPYQNHNKLETQEDFYEFNPDTNNDVISSADTSVTRQEIVSDTSGGSLYQTRSMNETHPIVRNDELPEEGKIYSSIPRKTNVYADHKIDREDNTPKRNKPRWVDNNVPAGMKEDFYSAARYAASNGSASITDQASQRKFVMQKSWTTGNCSGIDITVIESNGSKSLTPNGNTEICVN